MANAISHVPLTPLGAEPDFSDMAAAVQATARRFTNKKSPPKSSPRVMTKSGSRKGRF